MAKRAARWLPVLLLLASSPSRGADAAAWRWSERPGEAVALVRGAHVVWQFNYGRETPKPYFHPVALPDGPTLTWNQPPDHPWHHALWFSWKFINGVNYWEPDPATGRPAGSTQWRNVRVTTRDDGTAAISMELVYRPVGGEPALREQRGVTVSAPEADGRYHFDWTSVFTAGDHDVTLDRTPLPGEPGGKAYGGYAGLSVRLARELTQRGADSTEGPVTFNQQQRFRGRALALDYHGRIGEREVGIAMCDHPANLNHPTPWYVIRAKPMSYFSPAVICYGPHTLKAGQRLTLRYRVLVHPGRWGAERLRDEYERFVR